MIDDGVDEKKETGLSERMLVFILLRKKISMPLLSVDPPLCANLLTAVNQNCVLSTNRLAY